MKKMLLVFSLALMVLCGGCMSDVKKTTTPGDTSVNPTSTTKDLKDFKGKAYFSYKKITGDTFLATLNMEQNESLEVSGITFEIGLTGVIVDTKQIGTGEESDYDLNYTSINNNLGSPSSTLRASSMDLDYVQISGSSTTNFKGKILSFKITTKDLSGLSIKAINAFLKKDTNTTKYINFPISDTIAE